MATQAQIIANRNNAQKSTGPSTTDGKAIASQNSIKHGIFARQTVITSESHADFDLYRDRILDELNPATPMESMLAERIVNLSWRLKRSTRIQNQTIDTLSARNTSNPLLKLTRSLGDPSASDPELALGRVAIKDFSNSRVLERLLMYERRIENSLYKTILELQKLILIKNLNPEHETPFNPYTH